MKKIGALIVNWNGAADSTELVHSLEACTGPDIQLRVAIVDNASEAADVSSLRALLAEWQGVVEVQLRENKVNVGVPSAYNQAIQMVGFEADYYLRLDNDVVVDSDGLRAMIAALEEDSQIGVVGGNVKFYHDRERDNGGAVTIGLRRGRTDVTFPLHPVKCDGVLGCIMGVRGDLVRTLAPEVFDGRLFIFADESELSLRARELGFTTQYLPNLIGYHKGGSSTEKVKYISQYYSTRNWTLLRFKYLGIGKSSRVAIAMAVARDTVKNVLLGRWWYPLGVAAGAGMHLVERLDDRARTRRA